ncbi:MAG: hypothetical protein V4475_07070 [Pseudomonadota bacterium]
MAIKEEIAKLAQSDNLSSTEAICQIDIIISKISNVDDLAEFAIFLSSNAPRIILDKADYSDIEYALNFARSLHHIINFDDSGVKSKIVSPFAKIAWAMLNAFCCE